VIRPVPTVSPERFGRYVLLDRIGEGGMAEVYRAVMPGAEGFKRTFVIKKILAQLNQSTDFVEMFVREARTIALLNHPNIVQVFDFGSVDGQYFLAMEYLRGHDVLAVIRRLRDMKRMFPIPVAAFIAHEVAGCLAYAHELTGADGRSLDIVHRDVSPSNVMCLREGGVKLLDFGIASGVGDFGPEQTDQSSFRGKIPYMAPERLRNEPFDGRSDLYSLGVMLWEMLTRKRLFRGDSDAETVKNVLELPVRTPSSLRPEVPASLDAIVMRMLERDPTRRYQTGHELAEELEEVVRETKFKSRHLPRLLVDLFGSSSHSSQIAIDAVSAELLDSIRDEYSAEGSAGSAPEAPLPITGGGIRSRRRWGIVAGVGLSVATLVTAFGLYVFGGSSSPASPHVPAATSAPVPTKIPAEEPPLVPAVPPPVAQVQAEPPAAEPVKPVTRRRSRKARAGVHDNAIAGGRSIDPFAEAAIRGQR